MDSGGILQLAELEPCVERCAALFAQAISVVGGKWTPAIYFRLSETDGSLRFAELERLLAPITPKELARHLKELERAGLVERRVHATTPPSVDYRLTDLGRTLEPSLRPLVLWSAKYGLDIARNRAASAPLPKPKLIGSSWLR